MSPSSAEVAAKQKPWTDSSQPSAWSKFTKSMTDNSVTRGVSGAFNKTSQKVSDGVKPRAAEPDDQLSLSKATKASPDMYVSVARLQEKNGNDDEAITMYKRALGVDPDHIVALVNLGRILDRKG